MTSTSEFLLSVASAQASSGSQAVTVHDTRAPSGSPWASRVAPLAPATSTPSAYQA
ncbi:MAG: hypothetical protein U1F43_31550 [Myxococcota bacterium]